MEKAQNSPQALIAAKRCALAHSFNKAVEATPLRSVPHLDRSAKSQKHGSEKYLVRHHIRHTAHYFMVCERGCSELRKSIADGG
jgi:hypothetical protein